MAITITDRTHPWPIDISVLTIWQGRNTDLGQQFRCSGLSSAVPSIGNNVQFDTFSPSSSKIVGGLNLSLSGGQQNNVLGRRDRNDLAQPRMGYDDYE